MGYPRSHRLSCWLDHREHFCCLTSAEQSAKVWLGTAGVPCSITAACDAIRAVVTLDCCELCDGTGALQHLFALIIEALPGMTLDGHLKHMLPQCN